MRILITNDDGIRAPGIQKLWQSLMNIADVYVAAPSMEQSAKSQAITIHEPIRVDKFVCSDNITAWQIGGTPADCVKLALETLMPKQPDLLISGINRGSNLGTDVLYSGTVGAALEGGVKGILSLALSVDTKADDCFADAAAFAVDFVQNLSSYDRCNGQILNINFPERWRMGDKVAVTALGRRDYINLCEARTDPSGRTYYWLGGKMVDLVKKAGTDIAETECNAATITPLRLEMTDYNVLDSLKGWCEKRYGS